jgi:DNA-binding IclR family transcriptional regulator
LRLPLHATGVGKVLLAHADKTLLADVLARSLVRHTITNPRQLSRALADVRRKGFAFGNEEMTLGRVSVAVPIRSAQDDVVAALSIVGRSNAIDVAGLLPAVRTAGLSISRANGDLRPMASSMFHRAPAGAARQLVARESRDV